MVFRLQKTITYRLNQTGKALHQRSTSMLSDLNIHPGQDLVLKALADKDGQTMSVLAASLSVQPPTVTKMVTRLSAQGFVERRADRSDGRSACVFLTSSGRGLISKIDEARASLEEKALKGIDTKDVKRLRKLLRQVNANLGESSDTDA